MTSDDLIKIFEKHESYLLRNQIAVNEGFSEGISEIKQNTTERSSRDGLGQSLAGPGAPISSIMVRGINVAYH